ncbi:hypothetical protein NDU88_002241 [Pleurodeles waltl]|uniref:Uncharacterized protein n=1 Tax=Pleurodeles waltl TaxID=8319 RepID=A0AAV7TK80_PLEWA|nr:hypothetical protein NDU88_002241 [Pleurodeles waltl]
MTDPSCNHLNARRVALIAPGKDHPSECSKFGYSGNYQSHREMCHAMGFQHASSMPRWGMVHVSPAHRLQDAASSKPRFASRLHGEHAVAKGRHSAG